MTDLHAFSSATRAVNRPPGSTGALVSSIVVLCGVSMLGFGVWACFSPSTFGAFINYAPYNEHLIRDVGAFQIGIGITVLLALRWSDPIAIALSGFVGASALHTLSHYVDREIGGHDFDVPTFATLTLVGLVGIWLHLRRRTS
jgi:hypothetical protein